MEFVNSFLEMLKTADDPTPYIVLGLVLLVFIFVVVRSVLHTAIIFSVVAILALGGLYLTGYSIDFSQAWAKLSESFSQSQWLGNNGSNTNNTDFGNLKDAVESTKDTLEQGVDNREGANEPRKQKSPDETNNSNAPSLAPDFLINFVRKIVQSVNE